MRSRKTWARLLATFFVAAGAVGALQAANGPDPKDLQRRVRQWRQAHEVEIVRELADLLALPNLASDGPNIRRNAEHIAASLKRRGVDVRLLETAGAPPAVYGERKTPGARHTVLVYAHYDGQPVDPARWSSPPWKPVLRTQALEQGGKEVALESLTGPLDGEWRLYSRSASDDKAPIAAVMAALDALAAAGAAPSVNLKFLFEGEEEAGSPHMRAMLETHRELLRADLWLLCDGPVHPTRRMQLYFGARGIVDVEITTYGATRTLHSGHYGNWAPNPALELARLLAGLRDADGRVQVAGFYDDVRAASSAERHALAAVPDGDRELRQELGLASTLGSGGALAESVMLPALNVRGLSAGGVGEHAANAIPNEARASIDFRLVPDQTPAKVRERVEAHLQAQGWTIVRETPDAAMRRSRAKLIKLDWGEGYPPARTPVDGAEATAVARVLEEGLSAPLIRVPTLGGSVPMYLFTDVTGSPVVGVPIVNHDNNQHAADENLRLQNLWDGIEVLAVLLARLGPPLDRR